MREQHVEQGMNDIPIINLAKAPGEKQAWTKPRVIVYLWGLIELLVVTNPVQISSGLRVRALRLFGAKIGEGVIFRPRTRVKFPWNLEIGDHSWIGEGVWIHNQDRVHIEHDVVISQEAFITTGSHSIRRDMALITKPIHIQAGAWLTTRSVVLGGAVIGRSSVVAPNTVVTAGQLIRPNTVFGTVGTTVGVRFAGPGDAEN